jgi:predicted aspartyl protease
VAVTIPIASAAAAPRGSIIVPVQFAGRAAIVSAILNRSVSANLILDTGASSTVISRRLAGLLSIRPTGTAMGQTVGGMITAPIARLTSIKVGAAEIAELSVIVHDFSRDPRIDGLLGMDFLGQYHVGLDSQKQLLVLSPR